MAIYRQVKRVSDLDLLSKVIDDAQVLLAVSKKNWQTSLKNINQQKIEKIEYDGSTEDGKINSISLRMKDGSIINLGVQNGSTGDKGKTGKTGERGDKGDSAVINTDRSANYLMIANDGETNDPSKVLSALKGVEMNKSIHELRETYMSDEKYQLLFNELVFMDAEFISTQDEEQVLLFNEDPADHKLYIKYWTYESDGSADYFVYNDFAKTYDSINADLWNDIYLGETKGYFIATNAQLTDGNDLYVLNKKDNTYSKITVDETGNKSFVYYIKDADCSVNVAYDKQTKTYDYSLIANELKISVYYQSSSTEYTRITNKEDLDLSGFTLYYEKVDDEYVPITDINAYIEKKELRYYKLVDSTWVEVESLNEIKTSDFEEYIEVYYTKLTNTNVFTHYKPVTTIFETYYETYVGTLTNYSISFYVYDDNREYYTRRLVEKSSGNWDYEYTKINIPFWVDAEYITDEEDQTVLLLFSDKEQSEIETITPIYIDSIEFEENEIEIANGSVKDISVYISPSNANVTDMILDYDDSLIAIYEDGRIAAAHTTATTTETIVTLTSAINENIKDSIKVKYVTPISEIELNVPSIELYPGNTKQLEYTTVPAEVTNNNVIWSVTDEKMIKVSETGLVELVKDENGEYTTGTCKLICTAADGYGAKKEINVLVAIPVGEIMFGKYEKDETTNEDVFKPNNAEYNMAFVGLKNTLNVVVEPKNATEQTIEYYSSDDTIISIDSKTGEYTPLQKGEAYLYAKTTDGTNKVISKRMVINIGVTKIDITGIDSTLDIGLTNEYEVTLTPELPDNNEIEIVVSNKSLVHYTEPVLVEGTTNKYKGTITALAAGPVNISFIAKDGTKTGNSVDMTITIPINDLSFAENRISMFVGDMVALQAIIGPHDATNAGAELTWKSSNDSIATVDGYGRVQAKSAGKVIISAIVKDSTAVMASCVITINIKCTDLIINNGLENYDIILGNTAFISSMVIPDSANNQFIEWMSSDESIVSVNENGIISANNIGSAMITSITTDGSNISKSFNVNVVYNIIETPSETPENNPEGGEEVTE